MAAVNKKFGNEKGKYLKLFLVTDATATRGALFCSFRLFWNGKTSIQARGLIKEKDRGRIYHNVHIN